MVDSDISVHEHTLTIPVDSNFDRWIKLIQLEFLKKVLVALGPPDEVDEVIRKKLEEHRA